MVSSIKNLKLFIMSLGLLVAHASLAQTPSIASFGITHFDGPSDSVFASGVSSYGGYPGYYIGGYTDYANYGAGGGIFNEAAVAVFTAVVDGGNGILPPTGYSLVLEFDVRGQAMVDAIDVTGYNPPGPSSVTVTQEAHITTPGDPIANLFVSYTNSAFSPTSGVTLLDYHAEADYLLDWTTIQTVNIPLTFQWNLINQRWQTRVSYNTDFIQISMKSRADGPGSVGGMAIVEATMLKRCRPSISP